MSNFYWIISCEHGGNDIPPAYQSVFAKAQAALTSHRGYDIGALPIAQALANQVADFSQLTTISRLLVELNRSPHHPSLWSEFTKPLSTVIKQTILQTHYWPYRQAIEQQIQQAIAQGKTVIHISVHSFTPVLDGQIRQAEIGLLYDPSHTQEKQFCQQWSRVLQQLQPTWCIRRNYPYQGKADGLVTYLRKKYPAYIGIELEMNQQLTQTTSETLKQTIATSLINMRNNQICSPY